MSRVTWTPTDAEVRALVRAATWTVFRRDAVVLACLCAGLGILALPLVGPGGAAMSAGVPFLVLVAFFWVVTRHRNARVVGAAYPAGREAAAEARATGLFLDTAVQTTELPWGRLVDPRVHGVVVRVRDTVARRRVVIPRQLCPDSMVARLADPADQT